LWIVGAPAALRLLTDYLASSEGTVWHHDDLPVRRGRLEAGASASGPADRAATAMFNPGAVY
jgi:hypothetical protein